MAILAIGGTGQIGSLVIDELVRRDASVRVVSRSQPKGSVPAGVEWKVGDIMDVGFTRELLADVTTVFLLNPAVSDELARALMLLGLIDEAGIKRVVYVSMMGADRFLDSSRATAKLSAEQAIQFRNLPTSILRPNAVFQNDLALKASITNDGVYSTPLGDHGVTLVDARDVAEVAAIEVLRREAATDPLPTETIEVVGPETFTGQTMSALWSAVLDKPVTYAGDDLDAVEQVMGKVMPPAAAYDLKLVFQGILREGVLGAPGATQRLTAMLGRPLRNYRDFAGQLLQAPT